MKKVAGYYLPAADTHFERALQRHGHYQLDHLEAALSHVTEWNAAVDGGAHVGLWTVELAKRFKLVVAYEPAWDCYQCLWRNTEQFSNVWPLPTALGNETHDNVTISDDPKRPGNTGSRFIGSTKPSGLPAFEMVRLDDMHMTDLNFLKLDLEGYEHYALMGAENTIRSKRPVVLLENKDFSSRYGASRSAPAELLRSWGAQEVAQIGSDHIFVFR
jgi:FkbM family methyltransferase